MKIRTPRDRYDLLIRRSDRVLEVGCGDNPHPRSNVVVDKFTDHNYHRSGDLRVLRNQTFIHADGEHLPFRDREFDYLICCQVLEHVENPARFLAELFRVSKRGYLETPSLIGERLAPKSSHKWILHEVDGILYLKDKNTLGFDPGYDLGELFQLYLPTHSIGFKLLERTHPNLFTIRIEWENDLQFVVDPVDHQVLKYFQEGWKLEWAEMFFPRQNLWLEFRAASMALFNIIKNVLRSKIFKKNGR
jgi:SAM-dependent methyltransferase